jgi:hypothetical protein
MDAEEEQPRSPDEIKERARRREGAEGLSELPPEALPARDRALDIELKRTYAYALLIGLGIQLAIADAVFVLYAWKGAEWAVSASVMDVWLGATVVEVVGIVYVVTRYLFPRRDVPSLDLG